ncbi:MAG: ABA4-like family protein [Hoeflea sp.]|uniref:ABA4-like family protein n=1 Tax=Hoeflea sp. TaxID=1940281 RepID=UPI0027312D98|nr:ABA4-like family protein [Hoeflea sp.]MDP2121570.1 ABA4-like family protein [Hoeflea sp.]MDP3523566.1 ABA4-like family protein [Hoeflea sp.]MDZ7603165.1 ABA4-like family protein [Hoeflea sp.]
MQPDTLFQLSGPVAMAGWLALALTPFAPRLAQMTASLVIPVILSIAYAALILSNWSGAEGGFGSLADVMLLFTNPAIALAGWLHYLAFDLFVGAWEVRTARRESIPHLLVLPCLVLTFLFGPIGLLVFLGLRLVRGRFATPVAGGAA